MTVPTFVVAWMLTESGSGLGVSNSSEVVERSFGAQRDGIAAIAQIADRFDDADWHRPSACEGWSALDLAGHVLTVANLWHDFVDRMEAGETSPPFRWDDFPDQNAKALAALPPSSGPERITAYVHRAHEWLDRVAALDPDQPLGVPPQDIVASQITLGSFIGFAANEWHAHAWDLGVAIGERYRPTNPEVLLEGLRSWFPQLESRGDSWRVVLRFQGRSLT